MMTKEEHQEITNKSFEYAKQKIREMGIPIDDLNHHKILDDLYDEKYMELYSELEKSKRKH